MINFVCRNWYLLLGVLVFFSCKSPSTYISQTPVVPLFEKKGDLHFDYGISLPQNNSNSDIGLSFKGAYALNNRLAISTNYFHNVHNIEVDEMTSNSLFDNWGVKHHSFDMSVGTYWAGVEGIHSNWRAEVFTGIGYSSLQNQKKNGHFINTKYLKYHLKPSVGFISKHVGLLMSLQINYLDYINWEDNLRGSFVNPNRYILENDGVLIVEPSLGIQIGAREAKIQLHYTVGSFTEKISIDNFNDTDIVSNRMISGSFIISLNTKRFKKDKSE